MSEKESIGSSGHNESATETAGTNAADVVFNALLAEAARHDHPAAARALARLRPRIDAAFEAFERVEREDATLTAAVEESADRLDADDVAEYIAWDAATNTAANRDPDPENTVRLIRRVRAALQSTDQDEPPV